MTVYFVRAANLGLIKIGYTAVDTAENRLSQLQTGQPFELFLLGTIPGGRDAEAGLHREFAEYRKTGEWFELPSEAVDLILLMIEQKSPWFTCRAFRSFSATMKATMNTIAALREENALLKQKLEVAPGEGRATRGMQAALLAERKARQEAERALEELRAAKEFGSSTIESKAAPASTGETSAITHEAPQVVHGESGRTTRELN
jgi:hypothetical protein